MIVKDAKAVARQWVTEEAGAIPGFYGAFFHGSVNWLPEDAELPETSDLDIMVVLDGPEPENKLGKFRYRGVLLEVSYLPYRQVESAEAVLGHYHLAGSFRTPGVIADPTGALTQLQATVARDYAKRRWVLKRCEHAQSNALNFLQPRNESDPLDEQVMGWLFGTGVTTHVLLTAGLKNPTVRRRYRTARELLAEYRRLDFHERLLEMLGCARMTRRRAEEHLSALAQAFDEACAVIKTPYRFAADMTAAARPVAIDGSRELIEQGFHREAVFWMLAVYCRSQWVLRHDAPADVRQKHSRGFQAFLADLGIASFADRQQRTEQVRAFLPDVWAVAQAVIAANPAIEPD